MRSLKSLLSEQLLPVADVLALDIADGGFFERKAFCVTITTLGRLSPIRKLRGCSYFRT